MAENQSLQLRSQMRKERGTKHRGFERQHGCAKPTDEDLITVNHRTFQR